ncbi:AI-2E family transporter [Rubinisphaera sp. JC750]|uniref:AI-2E family transporter n=1 Tax=Rubinisphaera sp. JC750 TaxID=2898658 RepID=UPI001F41E077|nr:AI-2E family transporter [Rubinisphaera sp. JC750]
MHYEKIQAVCLMTLTAIAIGFSIYGLRTVLVPFVIAVFVVSGIGPILDALQIRLHVNRLLAAGITFVAGLVIMFVLGSALWASTVELRQSAPAYRQRIQELVDRVENAFPNLPMQKNAEAVTPEKNAEAIDAFLDAMLHKGIATLSSAMLYLITTGVVVLIYVFFMLLGQSTESSPSATWTKIDDQIREYLRLKTVISLITGLIFGGVLAMFGIPMALTFGVLAFLLNYIPNIGPLVATVLPVPLIILNPEAHLLWIVAVIGSISAIQFVSGNIIEPKLMGDSTDLHPIVILLALMFWGMLWGIVGMFLATPITAGLKLVLDQFQATRPLGSLLAGRWTFPQNEQQPATADA